MLLFWLACCFFAACVQSEEQLGRSFLARSSRTSPALSPLLHTAEVSRLRGLSPTEIESMAPLAAEPSLSEMKPNASGTLRADFVLTDGSVICECNHNASANEVSPNEVSRICRPRCQMKREIKDLEHQELALKAKLNETLIEEVEWKKHSARLTHLAADASVFQVRNLTPAVEHLEELNTLSRSVSVPHDGFKRQEEKLQKEKAVALAELHAVQSVRRESKVKLEFHEHKLDVLSQAHAATQQKRLALNQRLSLVQGWLSKAQRDYEMLISILEEKETARRKLKRRLDLEKKSRDGLKLQIQSELALVGSELSSLRKALEEPLHLEP